MMVRDVDRRNSSRTRKCEDKPTYSARGGAEIAALRTEGSKVRIFHDTNPFYPFADDGG